MSRLSATDAFFAYIDSPTAPMNMGSVQVLKLPKGYKGDFFEEFREYIGERIHCVPKLRKLLKMNATGLPHWQDCKDFDLDYHVRRTRLRNGDEKELFQKLGRLQHIRFDMNKPLFMLYIIEGLQDGRIVLMQKFHHAMADGKTAVRIMDVFCDEGYERVQQQSASDEDESEDDSLLQRSLGAYLEDLRRTAVSVPGIVGAVRSMASEAAADMLQRVRARPVTVFNQTLSEQRLFALRHWPLDELTAFRKAAGLTFNDLGLVLLSGALRRYMDELDVLPDASLVCNIPVALKTENETASNALLAMWVSLGTQLNDQHERIDFIKSEVESSKAFVAELLEGVSAGQGIQLPSYLIKLASLQLGSPLIARLMPPPGNIGLSNVPAPNSTIHVLGAEVEALYGLPMLLQGQSVSVAFSSYDDKVVCSILCCEKALPEPERLFDYMWDEYQSLKKLYMKAPVRKKPRKKAAA